jgi:hypothetical protein
MGIPPKTLDVLLENTIEMHENDGGLRFDLGINYQLVDFAGPSTVWRNYGDLEFYPF